MKSITLSIMFAGMMTSLFSQSNWIVQVGAFNQKVALSYFTGLTGVYEVKDHNDIYHYYIGGFKTESEAKAVVDNAVRAGFRAYTFDLNSVQQQCGSSCREDNTSWIYFDYDKDNLRDESKRKLLQFSEVLKAHPGYKAGISGHTDNHGSEEYNVALSKRRVENAKKYLISLGIAESRINIDYKGEDLPIAVNEVNGHDTPAGRQWNRRVELAVYDEKNNKLSNLVKEPDIPVSLKQ